MKIWHFMMLMSCSMGWSAGCARGEIDNCADGSCVVTCQPNQTRCNNAGNVETCNAAGNGWGESEVCESGCLSGSCLGTTTVWAIDDGERIRQDDIDSQYKTGLNNPVWSPGQPIRLFALRDEVVAVQIVVEANGSALSQVTVELDELVGPAGATIRNAPNATDPLSYTGRWIEHFVEHFFEVERASGGPWGSLGGTDAGYMLGLLPDALIPVEVAPDWSPYPMEIPQGHNGIVWIDITIPRDATPGMYKGSVVVRQQGATLTTLPMEIEVAQQQLPVWPLNTMLYYDEEELRLRMGADVVTGAERHLWQLLHRHRISAMHGAMSTDDVADHLPALDGSLYSEANGYQGPGANFGDNVLSLGTYGGFDSPDAGDLTAVEDIADLLAQEGLLEDIDVFVYVIDEVCGHAWGQQWMDLLASSSNGNIDSVKAGWTCSESIPDQPVELVMTVTGGYVIEDVETAIARGKQVWVYNGAQPHAGSFGTDYATIATRVNGWIAAIYDIDRWFYWESTFWYDWNNGGLGEFDPFFEPETFHNQYNEYGQGDGVLLYPGRQVDTYTEHSIGMNGVIASIRLKNWRRGIQDAGYYQLAHAISANETERVGTALVPVALGAAIGDALPAWPQDGMAFFQARRDLWTIITGN